MKYSSIQHINILLQSSPMMNDIRSKLQELEQLNQAVTKLLPSPMSNYCSVANFRDGVLILTTKGPTWRNQVEFSKMDLLDQLRKSNARWAGIGSIKVTIDYLIDDLIVDVEDKYQHNSGISPQTVELMNNIVNTEIGYQPLAVGLKRLITKIMVPPIVRTKNI